METPNSYFLWIIRIGTQMKRYCLIKLYISHVYTDIVKNHSIELVNQKWLLLKIV